MSRYPGVKRRGKRGVLWIYYPKDGRKKWEPALDADGLPARTHAEAAAYRATRIAELAAGRWVEQPLARKGGATVADLLDHYERAWLPRLKERAPVVKLIASMRREHGALTLDAAAPGYWQAWVDRIQRPPRAVTASTAVHYALFIGRLYRVARKTPAGRELLGQRPNPIDLILLPSLPKPRRVAYQVAELEAVGRAIAARLESDQVHVRVAAERVKRWLALCLFVGLRVYEASRLRVRDVDLAARTVHPAGKTGPRVAAVPRALVPEVRRWVDGRDLDELVIGKPLAVPPYQMLRRIFAEAGVPWGSGLGHTIRTMRTTFVTAARAAGVEDGHLADQAGHSVQMSREWYARSTVEQRAAVADAAARRFATGLLPKPARRAATGARTATKSGRKSARTKG